MGLAIDDLAVVTASPEQQPPDTPGFVVSQLPVPDLGGDYGGFAG